MNVLDLRDRALLDGFFAMNGMEKKADEILDVLYNRDGMSDAQLKAVLVDKVRMLPCKVETLLDFLAVNDTREELLKSLGIYRGIEQSFDKALDKLISSKTI